MHASLFDNHKRMGTADKAELLHHLMKLVPAWLVSSVPNASLHYIVDGGGLLHKFSWPKNATYAEICAMYIRHVTSSYGHAVVVFDGYHGASTKDEAHRRRTGNAVGAPVSVSKEMRLTMSKKTFLGNASNKQGLINLLAGEMVKEGITVEHADGDADYKICMSACQSATTKPTVVVAEDSDVFQLLVHHADTAVRKLYMKMSKQSVCITTLKKKMDPSLSEALLFLHAISGCDTTSRPHGIGKVSVLKKYTALKTCACIFMSSSSSKKDVEKAGEEAMLVMYNCTKSANLTSARVEKFQVKVATSAGYVKPEKLPPTTDAASQHSLRTYHQVQAWLGHDLSPEDWGWAASADGLVPIRMTRPAAPEELLRTIKCNCGGRCDKKTCTCRKNGLHCTPACGQCKGIACLNDPQFEACDDDDTLDDEN